jgi:hypothetical protein
MSTKTPKPESHVPEGAGPTDPISTDTEGHGLSLVMGVNALSRKGRERVRRADDEQLKPLTKPFPRMREEKKA